MQIACPTGPITAEDEEKATNRDPPANLRDTSEKLLGGGFREGSHGPRRGLPASQVPHARELRAEQRGKPRLGNVLHELVVDDAGAVHNQLRVRQPLDLLTTTAVNETPFTRPAARPATARPRSRRPRPP